MTIEDLAALIQRTMASKDDLHAFRGEISEEMNVLRGQVLEVLEEMNATHADVRYIRSTVDKLVRSDIAQNTAIEDLASRTHRLEQKAGLAK